MEIVFKSFGTYRYFHVPEFVYNDLLHAESKGRFVQQEIIGMYDFRKVYPLPPAAKEKTGTRSLMIDQQLLVNKPSPRPVFRSVEYIAEVIPGNMNNWSLEITGGE